MGRFTTRQRGRGGDEVSGLGILGRAVESKSYGLYRVGKCGVVRSWELELEL